MQKKKLVLLLLVFVLPITIYSQSDYRTAILVNNSSDTLSGFIQYNSIKKLSQKIYFKKDFNSADAIEYTPSEIKGFVFVGWNEKYLSITSNESKPIFAKVLVEGSASLYLTSNYFYIGNDKYGIRAFYYRIPEPAANKESRAHGKLSFYLNDCARLKNKVMTVKFTSEELTKLILEYNMCISPSTERVTNNSTSKIYNLKEGYKLKVNAIISTSYTTLNLHDYSIDGEKEHNSGSISPEIGVELEHSSPKFSEFISLVTGISLGYESFLIQNTYKDYLKEKYTKIDASNIFVEFPIYVKTTYSTNKYGFNTGVGISHRIVISTMESKIQEVKGYINSTYSYTTDEFEPFYRSKTFLLLQLGISIPKGFLPKSSVNFRYMRAFGADEYSAVMTKYSLNYIIEL